MQSVSYNYFTLTYLFLITSILYSGCANPENAHLTLEQKAGQLLMVGFKGLELADSSHVVRDIEQYNLGGVILFSYDVPTDSPVRNIASPQQVQKLTNDLQATSDKPLFIAVDQEGGRVARLSPDYGFPGTVSAEYLGELNIPDTTRKYAVEQSTLIDSLGFNVNFAPVVDLNINPENPVIGRLDRSFSDDPDIVTQHAGIVIEEHKIRDVLPVLKHFPGHGSAWNDSHVGMADVSDTWQEIELEPYRRLIASGNQFAVMTAHVLNENLDPELPATLSEEIQDGLLRDSLGFDGLLFSDDMQMEAIRSFYGLEFAIEHALNAGVDMLVFGNNSVYQPDIVPNAVQIIVDLVEEGAVSEDRIDEAYERVMDTKRQLGLVD